MNIYDDYAKKDIDIKNYKIRVKSLEEENKKLKEFKAKQEEMMFLIGASIELAKPKTAGDAEKLQKGKGIYEKLHKEELYYLREENRKLKESLDIATKCSSKEEDGIIRLSEENRKLKLHIEAKDKAYTALLKDYEEIKEDRKKILDKIEAGIERFKAFRNR